MVPTPPDSRKAAVFPPDLAHVVATWASLPAAIKAGMLAMIDTAMPRGE